MGDCCPDKLVKTSKSLRNRCCLGHPACIVPGFSDSSRHGATKRSKSSKHGATNQKDTNSAAVENSDLNPVPQEANSVELETCDSSGSPYPTRRKRQKPIRYGFEDEDETEQGSSAKTKSTLKKRKISEDRDLGGDNKKFAPPKLLKIGPEAAKSPPVGVWESPNFPSSYSGRVLVLWDLDQANRNSCANIETFIANTQIGVKEIFGGGDAECVFIGGINADCGQRKFWHDAIANKNTAHRSSFWTSCSFRLHVVPLQSQAVDEKLVEIGISAVSAEDDPPRAVVLITNDKDFVPVLEKARNHNVPSMVLFRLKNPGYHALKETCDVFVLVHKTTGAPQGILKKVNRKSKK